MKKFLINFLALLFINKYVNTDAYKYIAHKPTRIICSLHHLMEATFQCYLYYYTCLSEYGTIICSEI